MKLYQTFSLGGALNNLSWDDITISFNNLNLQLIYQDWNWLINETIRPIMMSTFGDLFYQKKDLKVYYLDTLEGNEKYITNTESEFIEFINIKENQENYLLSELVFNLINKGFILKEKQCYSFIIPPIIGGKAETNNVKIINIPIWISIIGQLHKQVKELPIGTKINKFKISK